MDFHATMLEPTASTLQGPCYVGVLLVTVVSGQFTKRTKSRCVLSLGKQTVVTKVTAHINIVETY